jgi:predicted enzyme involved in methoxymalonyl-ACP biosynthesis
MKHVVEHAKFHQKKSLKLQCRPKERQPSVEGFYEQLGFTRNKSQDKGSMEHASKPRVKMTLQL